MEIGIIEGKRVVTLAAYADFKKQSKSAVTQAIAADKLPVEDFAFLPNMRFINLDKLELEEQKTLAQFMKVDMPDSPQLMYSYTVEELGNLHVKWITDTQKQLAKYRAATDHLTSEVETLKAVYDKSQAELNAALDRENALRDEKEKLITEVSNGNVRYENVSKMLDNAGVMLENQTAELEVTKTDLEKATKDLAQVQTVLTDTKHDNDLKVLEIKTLQSEKAGLEKENATLQAKLTEKESLLEQTTAAYKQYFEKYQTAKDELAKAQKDEEIAVLKLEKELDRIEALEEKLETQKANYAIFGKILEGNSRFAEPFEVWFEKNPQNPNNMRPLVKTSLGYFLGTGTSVKPENELVSLADYPTHLKIALLNEDINHLAEGKAKKGGGK